MRHLDRREFLAVAALLGVGAAASACGDDDPVADVSIPTGATVANLDAEVIIIGAGAAGMAAGHLLAQRGIDFRILEAGPTYGGRIKHTRDFVDFPIPLGGEWLHADPDTLNLAVNDSDTDIATRLVAYSPDDSVAGVYDGELEYERLGAYSDLKFAGSSWLDFFETYVLASSRDRMVFDTQVLEVDHTGDDVVLRTADGAEWSAAAVVVTAPMKILQDGDIAFVPDLPPDHLDALARANIWTGMKVFVEFSEAFYPTFIGSEDDAGADGQRAYYDAACGQDTDANVLGLFTVGELAEPYQALDPGEELRDHILGELDYLFDGAASRSYIQHVSQNWADEPFVRAAYLADTADEDISQILGQTVDGRVLFAGCSYTREYDWSSVHTAVRSARAAVDELTA